MVTYIWLALVIIFLVAELATVGLTTIWFAVGALIALILSIFGAGLAWQVTLFVVVSVALLILTRPLAQRYINARRTKTNIDAIVGMTGRIIEPVNGIDGTGAVLVDGKTWSAKAVDERISISKDTIVRVREVSGVKLIVEPVS